MKPTHCISCESTAIHRRAGSQRGASLVVSLLMLLAMALLGMSAAQIVLQETKASRNEIDRRVASLAAEAALFDAESDIETSARSYLFGEGLDAGFAEGCDNGGPDIYLGLCRPSADGNRPVWLSIDFTGRTADWRSVPYGHFTGKALQTSVGPLPARPPRYIIERLANGSSTVTGNSSAAYYRITAIGFGMRDVTQVVLQTLYRKAGGAGITPPAGRFSWREIPNWREMRDALEKK